MTSAPAGPAIADAGLRGRMLAYLAAHNVLTLATTDPWAAAVLYVNDGFVLYFLSSPETRHCQGLRRDPRVAVTVHEDYADWRAIKGIQLEGAVEPVDAGDLPRVRALYAAKFPIIGSAASPAIVAALARIRWYRITPQRVCFVDNAAGFGHRDCIDLAGGERH